MVYVLDAADHERLNEGWEVFGELFLQSHFLCSNSLKDSLLSSPKILHLPLLLLANKQDSPGHLSVEEIRENYEQWYQGKKDSARRIYGEESDVKHERFASLDVMGISALEGYFP